MRRLYQLGVLLALIIGLAGPLPTAAQDDDPGGRGAIITANPYGAETLGSLNPLRCGNTVCRRVTDLLYPWLIGVDPATGHFAPTSDSLALTWDMAADGLTITVHLRDDMQWTDGDPVTAYDVFFSYLANASEDYRSIYTDRVNALIVGAAPLDAQTIAFALAEATCTALDVLRFPIIPADPEFVTLAANSFNASDAVPTQFARWQGVLPDDYFVDMSDPAPERDPLVTAGIFEVDRVQPLDYVRLVREDGTLGFAYIDLPSGQNTVDLFLAGETNLLLDPPFNRRGDLRAADGIQVYESPGLYWLGINLNLADPTEPQNAVDENGDPLDQGYHPIFGDGRVRRAIQQGIDVPALIEASLLGNGTIMPSNTLPTSWAYDPDLAPIDYDPMAAARLLEAAGWKDVDNIGIRSCVTCDHARKGTRLSFDLIYVSSSVNDSVVNLIEQQLRMIGVQASPQAMSFTEMQTRAAQQRYDAYLSWWVDDYPLNPDQTALFASQSDILDEGLNTGSYANPRVDELLAQAHNVPGCDYEARADLYHEIQAILQDDQPFIWLFAANDMIAVQGGVAGFAPYPHTPLWNVNAWVITE
ncbi:MAG: hypothetical protein JXA10_16805 [Anaerolineae bacterium]|nr:hypothetical protein [Anaerolineae bacterium]